MSQLSLDPERPSRARIEALAGVLAGYSAPGYETWSKVPERIKVECRAAAESALIDVQQRVRETR